MQTSANLAGPSNSAKTLVIKPSPLSSLYLGPSNDTTREIRQEERPVQSSWIGRLKPRDNVGEHLNGGSCAEGAETNQSEKCKYVVGNIELGSATAQAPEEEASPKVNGLKSRAMEGVKVAGKTQKIIGQDVVGGQVNDISNESLFSQGEGKIACANRPSMAGFGPWINLKSGRNSAVKAYTELGSNSKVNPSAGISTLDSSKQAQGRSSSTVCLINATHSFGPSGTQGDTGIPSCLGKPPLSPAHGKPGLPPRPPTQTTALPSKVTSMGARRLLHHPLVGTGPRSEDVEMGHGTCRPVIQHDMGRPVLSGQGNETHKLTEFKFMGPGSFANEPKPVAGSFPDSCIVHTDDHGQATSMLHLPISSSAKTDHSQLSRKHTFPILGDGTSAFVRPQEQKPNGAGAQFERLTKGDKDLRPFCGGTKSDGSESAKNVTRSSHTPGNSHRSASIPDKGDMRGRSPPSLPWEMFTEPTGALKKEREHFVEVYNRARDELKKQRPCQSVTRSNGREMDGGPRLALGPGNIGCDSMAQFPLLKQNEVLSGAPRAVKIISPEHRNWSLGLNLKDHGSVGLKADEDPAISPATLRRSTTGATDDHAALSSKQGHNLLQGELKLNLETRNDNKSSHRPDQSFTGSGHTVCKAVVFKRPASKPEDQKGLPSPPLGKRSHVSFEDLALSRVEEKCAVSSRSSRRKIVLHPQIWLSRWHATSNSDTRGSMDTNLSTEIVGNGRVRYFSQGINKFKDDEVLGRGKDTTMQIPDNEGGWKSLKMGSSTALPSAAAMAIVGTAARQYCSSAQSQRAGSFAFWSGFGRQPTPHNEEGKQGKGKERVVSNGSPNLPTC